MRLSRKAREAVSEHVRDGCDAPSIEELRALDLLEDISDINNAAICHFARRRRQHTCRRPDGAA
jgi:hypothetical protein